MAAMATDTSSSIVPAGDRSPSSWGLGDGQAIPWEYAPAPEARDIVTLKERYGLFIGGRDVPASDGGTFATIDPATEVTSPMWPARPQPMPTRRSAPRAARRPSWGTLSGKERAKYLFRIARILQEWSRH